MAYDQKLLAIILILSAFCAFVQAATPIRKCGNNLPMPLEVQINDCNKLPCDIWKHKLSNIAIQFVATKNTMTSLHAYIALTTMGIQVPFDLSEQRSNVCENLLFGAYCPLDAGEDVTYHLIMQMHERQPEVPLKMEVTLRDKNDDAVIACFITDAHVRS